jgi:hypothetical protein
MLVLENSSDNDSTPHWFTGNTGAKVVVAGTAANTGSIWFYIGSGNGADIRNFYQTDGTTSAATTDPRSDNKYGAVTAGTYTWDATINSGNGGWKAGQ